jgi:hypothetical protein
MLSRFCSTIHVGKKQTKKESQLFSKIKKEERFIKLDQTKRQAKEKTTLS